MPRWCCDVVPLIRKWGESGMQLSWRHLSLPLLPLMRWWSGLMMTVALPANFTFWKLDFSQMKHYMFIYANHPGWQWGWWTTSPAGPPVLITAQGAGEDLDRTYYMGIGLEGGGLSGCHTLEISPIMPSEETQSGLRPTNKNDKCHEIYSSQHWIKNSHSTHKVFSFKADE